MDQVLFGGAASEVLVEEDLEGVDSVALEAVAGLVPAGAVPAEGGKRRLDETLAGLTFRQIERKAPERGLLVFFRHVSTGLSDHIDHLIQTNFLFAGVPTGCQ